MEDAVLARDDEDEVPREEVGVVDGLVVVEDGGDAHAEPFGDAGDGIAGLGAVFHDWAARVDDLGQGLEPGANFTGCNGGGGHARGQGGRGRNAANGAKAGDIGADGDGRDGPERLGARARAEVGNGFALVAPGEAGEAERGDGGEGRGFGGVGEPGRAKDGANREHHDEYVNRESPMAPCMRVGSCACSLDTHKASGQVMAVERTVATG